METARPRRTPPLWVAGLILVTILAFASQIQVGAAPGSTVLTTVIDWYVIASGGGPRSGGSVASNDTVGQAVIGVSSSGNVAIDSAGYWQPEGAAAPGSCSLSASRSGSNVVLAWTASVGATGYKVYRGTTPYFTPGAPYATTGALTFTDTGVIGDPNTNHYYLVAATNSGGDTPCANRVGEFDFALQPGPSGDIALNDIATALDASAVITDAESLADYVEAQGGAPVGSVRQLLKWDAFLQNFLAWSHEFGFGDNFPTAPGDYVFLVLDETAPTLAGFVGRVPNAGEVVFPLAAQGASPDCALNFLSLPFDQAVLSTADLLSDDIGTPNPPGPATVVQALDWEASLQNFLAWSNEFGFGDDFPTTIGYPYIVCLSNNNVPSQWP
jgi:hypothetical protein